MQKLLKQNKQNQRSNSRSFTSSRVTMSGFEYSFVADVATEYCCPICECVMREPVQTKCGHRFCKHCLEKSMKRKRKCPIDRQALDERSAKDIYPDVAIKRTILDFIVKCPNERYGCQWTGELRTIEAHQTSCSFVGVKCTNKDCEETFLKKDLNNHMKNKCPKRKVECHYCKKLFVWCMRQDHFDACTKYPMDCLQGCREKIARDKMNDHIEESCPYTEVQCTFAYVGCQVKVQRKAIQDHLKRNTESHWKLVCDRLQELQVSSTSALANMTEMQNEISTVLKKIKQLSEAVLQSGGLQDLRDKVAVTNKKLEEMQSREDATDMLSGLQSEVVAIKNEVEELSTKVVNDRKLMELQGAINQLQKLIPKIDNLQGLRKEVSGINKKLQKLQEAITSLEKRKSDAVVAINDDRRMLEQIEQVEWQLRREVSDIRQGLLRDRMQMQSQPQRHQGFPDLEGLKTFMVYIAFCSVLIVWSICDSTFVKKEKLQDFEQKLEQSHTFLVDRTHFLQDESDCKTEKFVRSFTNFNSRIRQAKTGSKLCFFIQPFFTEPYGYKMCIAVCPNGNPAQNTHLSLFVHLLSGNNDHLLPWPFQQKVAFILVDQQDAPTMRKNIKAEFSPNNMPHLKESAFAKPKSSSFRNTIGFGYHYFISHFELQKRLYIRDDTILVKLEVYPMHCDKDR